MESLKESMATMAEMFNNRMAEFQQELKNTSSSSVTTSSLAVEFSNFKKFIASVLETLQKQVEFLYKDMDQMEMQRRRKIILLHGIPENQSEDVTEVVCTLVKEKLNVPGISSSSISRCHRLGYTAGNKPRPIIVKFCDISQRNKVWFSKSKLKGSGITQSEFLTRMRHSIFLEARKRFGITRCWTKDGTVNVLATDGSLHRVESLAELDVIPSASGSTPEQTVAALASTVSAKPKQNAKKATGKAADTFGKAKMATRK